MNGFINVWPKTASLVLHTRQLKEDNEKKIKQNAERYGVHEGRWVKSSGQSGGGKDLWNRYTETDGTTNFILYETKS